MAVFAGDGQNADPGLSFANNLAVQVKGADDKGISGVPVTFHVVKGDGTSGTFAGNNTVATVVTGSEGVAAAPVLTGNSNPGEFHVDAIVNGIDQAVRFTLKISKPAEGQKP